MVGAALVLLLLGAPPKTAKAVPDSDPLVQLLEVPGNERWKKLLLENEPKRLWEQITWTPIEQAQELGLKTGKPMLVTIKTSSKGDAKSPFT